MGAAIIGPALAVGGVWPATVPVFALVVAAALLAGHRSRQRFRVPAGLGLGLLAAAATLVQVLPGPGLRATLAPSLHAWIEQAQLGLTATGWPSISPVPADTALEVVRLLALTGLVLVCAQRSWRITAALVAAAGATVAVIGLAQHGLGLERIYGLYEAQHVAAGPRPALLATFINPNHQSGLLLLGIFATAGLGIAYRGDDAPLEPRLVLAIGLVLQLTALVLSLSRAALVSGAAVGLVAVVVGRRPSDMRPTFNRAPRLAWLATLVGLVIGVGTLGAWTELATLVNGDALDHATRSRLQLTAAAPSLLDLAPLTGIGRGAFGDVYPAFDPSPSHVWFSHLECAPLTMLVEWGPIVGGALLVGLAAWWLHAMRRSGDHHDAAGRRVVLLGLMALAVQGLADFSLEFLGVAAPACALAGALSPTRPPSLPSRRVRTIAVTIAVLGVASSLLLPQTWAWQTTTALRSDDRDVTDGMIAARPLHARLHRRRARAAAQQGDTATARVRARTAVRLQPGHVDGWLLLAAAARAEQDLPAERRAIAQALAHLHRRVDEPLARYLVDRIPRPADLAVMAPLAPAPWEHLVAGLLPVAPAHVDAVAAIRSAREPGDPIPLHYRVEASLRLQRPALALHHARLWRQLDPTDVQAHLAVVRALEVAPRSRPVALRDALDRALAQADLPDLHLRALLEEQLLRALLRVDDPDQRDRTRALAEVLRTRPADDATRRRRIALVDPVLVAR